MTSPIVLEGAAILGGRVGTNGVVGVGQWSLILVVFPVPRTSIPSRGQTGRPTVLTTEILFVRSGGKIRR